MPSKNDTTNTQLLKLVRYAARTAHVAASKRDAAIRDEHPPLVRTPALR
jgi:hypothetical protein